MTFLYVAPFFAYLVGTMVAGRFDEGYPVAYAAVVVMVIAIYCIGCRLATCGRNDAGTEGVAAFPFEVHFRVLPGVVVGVVGIVLWVWLCELHLETMLTSHLPAFLQPGERESYNPFDAIQPTTWAWAFVAVRLVGIAVVVPVAEELFWRGFLLRWLIDPEWKQVELGRFTASSCAIVTLMFTMAHPEWLAAATYCLLINGLLYWKRDLWQCIIAHAVSNFLLAAYVIQFEQWYLW